MPHAVRTPGERTYPETNCYTDILIELLHARGDEPLAALGFTVRMDFEGDQWTFFKPPPEDLERLFGVDIHEMQPYRPLPEQIAEQIAAGRTMIVELDSWYLPDTAATELPHRARQDARSIAEAIDRDGERLRYFHNAGLHELDGEDYRGVFRLGREFSRRRAAALHRARALRRRPAAAAATSCARRRASCCADHLARRPPTTRSTRFGARLGARPARACSRATPPTTTPTRSRPCAWSGSAFEICASHVDWLLGDEGAAASAALARIVEGSQGPLVPARAPARVRPGAGDRRRSAAAWDEAMAALDAAVG